MTQEEWAALVQRLEPEARENPTSYRRKVLAFGALGYLFIGLALAVLVALALLVVVLALAGPGILLKFLIPIGALGLLILRSLWVRLDPPEGVEVKRDEQPELFRMIDEVNDEVRGPKVHKVLIDDQPNAAIVQIPRRGGIFGQRNYLLLGLPYMHALSPDEFRAVVAHELGHLSQSHGRFGTWVYRIRTMWWQLLAGLEEKKHWTTGIFRRFFEWYVPRFDAYSFPLRRAHEFEADEAAAAAAGPQAAMTALLSGTLGARYLYEQYWPAIYSRADDEQEPPRSAFAPMAGELAWARSGEAVREVLTQELAREPDVADTHPSLAERVRHLGLDPEEVVRLAIENGGGPTAAEAFLQDGGASLAETFDRSWRDAIGEEWRERHRERQEARKQLQELEARAEREQLPVDDLRVLAALTAEFREPDIALHRYRVVLDAVPEDPQANFGVGSLLLDRDDDAGLAHLDRAMDADPEAIVPACELAIAYLEERGRSEEADRYRRRGEQQLEVFEAASVERAAVDVDDELEPADLDQALVEQIRATLERHEDVGAAYVVRKRLQHLAEEYPLYVVALIPRKRWRQLWKEADADEKDEDTLADRVASDLDIPVDVQVIVPGPRSGMDERLDAIPGAKIFSRD
jgi:Zn-dependent protease with chaperone function